MMNDERKPQDEKPQDAPESAPAESSVPVGADAPADASPADSSPADEAAPAAEPVRARDRARPRKKGNETLELIKTVVFALLIAMVIRTLLFQPFTIPTASMEPNLYEGDYIVVSKWSYGYSRHAAPWSPPLFEGRVLASEPRRGDIVVFKWSGDNQTDYIKRVIGLPGDTVQMINNRLYLNGVVVPDVEVATREVAGVFNVQPVIQMKETLPGGRSYTIQDYGPGNPLDNTEKYTVPAGHYFMIGDNRDNSLDSRASVAERGVGLVPSENLVGKAEIILASWKPGASLWKPWTWFNVRGERFFRRLS